MTIKAMQTSALGPPSRKSSLGGFPGLAMARYAKALVVARGDVIAANAYAEGNGQRWRDETPYTLHALKALVDPILIGQVGGNSALRVLSTEFLELVRPMTVLGRLEDELRVVPTNVSMLRVASGASAYWVGENTAKPVSKFTFARTGLTPGKLASIVVLTDEVIKSPKIAAERVVARELALGVAAFADKAFLDPSLGPIAYVTPGSITYGAPSIESSGATTAAAQADIDQLFSRFVNSGGMLEKAVLVLHPRTAAAMGGMVVAGGGLAFANIGARGGDIRGVPAMTSSACTLSGSPSETFAVLLDPATIMVSDDDMVEIDAATRATVQMSDSPTSSATTQVSLWQNNLVGVKAEQWLSWQRSDDYSVMTLRGIAY